MLFRHQLQSSRSVSINSGYIWINQGAIHWKWNSNLKKLKPQSRSLLMRQHLHGILDRGWQVAFANLLKRYAHLLLRHLGQQDAISTEPYLAYTDACPIKQIRVDMTNKWRSGFRLQPCTKIKHLPHTPRLILHRACSSGSQSLHLWW